MAKLMVEGGRPLSGRIIPSANKNAVLPALCASLLTREPVTFERVPDVTDVRKVLGFFEAIGSRVEADLSSGLVRLEHGDGLDLAGAVLPAGMRSVVMLVPPLLHRFGRARLEDEAKGCTLGVREIDPHLEVFQAFGARVERQGGAVEIVAPKVFAPARHWLEYASVTTTENFLMCAALAAGTSRLVNAACEPHVQEFCGVLAQMGARIGGTGGSTLEIEGRMGLAGARHAFADDFHEVATFLALGAVTGGQVEVRNNAPEQFALIDRTFGKFGVEVRHLGGWSRNLPADRLAVRAPFTGHLLAKVEAAPWPYIPADLLPIFVALGVRAEGQAMFWNKVYEGALGWTSELAKFGAHAVTCDPHRIITFGGGRLAPAEVESPYIIRVAIALLMVAASIPGRSTILNADPIRRAHPDFVENLRSLGAEVAWED